MRCRMDDDDHAAPAAKPASAQEMAAIPGVGDTKLERYGPAFLAAIMQHAAGE